MNIKPIGLKLRHARREDDGALKTRHIGLDVRQLDKEKRTIPISFSSETREVMTWDYELGGAVPEILSHSPDACDLTPLISAGSVLRNHDPNQIIGVPLDAAIDEKTKRGVAQIRFGTTECAEKTFKDVADGILRGVSVGYEVLAYERVKAGGRSPQGHEGPCMVATRWRVHELTLTPIPADSSVGVGRSKGTPTNTTSNAKESEMDKAIIFAMVRAAGLSTKFAEELIARNLPNADVVASAIEEERKKRAKRSKGAKSARSEERAEDEDEEEGEEEGEDEDEESRSVILSEREKGARSERKRQDTIRSAVAAAKLPAEFAIELIDANASIDKARAAIIAKLAAGDTAAVASGARGVDVERGGDGGEKKLRFLQTNLGRRAFAAMGQSYDDEGTKNIERAHVTLQMAVREILELRGIAGVRYMAPFELWEHFIRSQTQQRAAANASGDLANALSAIQNKSLSLGFNMAKPTWPAWARKGSLTDFKIAPWVQVSGAGQLRETGENGEILDSKVNDRAENRQLAVYARKQSITWESFQNDDLDAIGKAVFNLGLGAAKLPSRLIYTHLLANPTMSDGVAFFHANHGNLLTGAGSNLDASNKVAALAAAIKAFRKQTEPRAPNDTEFAAEPIDIDPGVVLVPPEHEYQADTLVNPNQFVLEGSNYFKGKFKTETEARLSNTAFTGYSLTAWYLAARAAEMDTAEVSFLNGNESPLTATWEEFGTLAVHFRAVLPCGVKLLDWRGMVKSDGA